MTRTMRVPSLSTYDVRRVPDHFAVTICYIAVVISPVWQASEFLSCLKSPLYRNAKCSSPL